MEIDIGNDIIEIRTIIRYVKHILFACDSNKIEYWTFSIIDF